MRYAMLLLVFALVPLACGDATKTSSKRGEEKKTVTEKPPVEKPDTPATTEPETPPADDSGNVAGVLPIALETVVLDVQGMT